VRVSQAHVDRRYVTFTGGLSNVTNADFRTAQPVGGATGGSSSSN
jgi:hypothetical protein